MHASTVRSPSPMGAKPVHLKLFNHLVGAVKRLNQFMGAERRERPAAYIATL